MTNNNDPIREHNTPNCLAPQCIGSDMTTLPWSRPLVQWVVHPIFSPLHILPFSAHSFIFYFLLSWKHGCLKKNSILNCTFMMSSSFGFRSFFRNKAAVCKVGDQSLENNQPSGEPMVELLRNKMNVIGTAREYKSPAVCLLHMK